MDLARLFPILPPRVPRGRWLIGLGLLALMITGFWLAGVFEPRASDPDPALWSPALFFSVMIAYIVPIYGYIAQRTAAAFEALVPLLEADAPRIDRWRRRIRHKPWQWLVTVLVIGTASGIAHNLLLNRSQMPQLQEALASAAQVSVMVGTQLVWIVVTLVVAALLDNALVLNQVAHHARTRLFDARRLRPLATVAVISTLALIGAQAAFPIMTMEDGIDPLAYVPGLLATGVPMVMLAVLPVWPVHRSLADEKRRMLDALDQRIAAIPLPDPDRAEALESIAPLLAYRREVLQSSEWPFDVGVMSRLGLYLIIPPLTWIGAALMENVVNAFL